MSMRNELVALLCASLSLTAPCIARSAGQGERPHHLSVILGTTEKSGKWAETVGVEYTYRLSKRRSVGLILSKTERSCISLDSPWARGFEYSRFQTSFNK